MGVPKFFRYISERYPCLSELVKEYQMPTFDNLYLDMNGIIHMCSHPDDNNPHFRITEERIFQDVFHYIEVLFRMIRPRKLFFMAIDGVAPRAKMNQQRGRRFRSAKDAEKQEEEALKKGETLPTEARFDSNCITPGTVFMAKLHEQLKYFVVQKISTDSLWQDCKIILSGHETPGEGEHKIMDYIRYMRSQPNYDPNTRHCLYGLDADLIMLGLCTHEPHFSLLREEVKFGKKSTKRQSVPEEITFFLLHLSLMRDYLELEFQTLKLELKNFKFDLEKIIDDWVLMGFLVGNDFIPNLPNLHIANGALPTLYKAYMEVLPTLDGYINEGGSLNLQRFEKFMQNLGNIDLESFEEVRDDLLYMEAKTGRKATAHSKVSSGNRVLEQWMDDGSNIPENLESLEPSRRSRNSDLAALIKETDDMCLDDDDSDIGDTEEDSSFINFKKDYYKNKLEYENVTPEVLREQAEGYVRAIQWNLNYYYNGVCSWSWYYPHHYSPYISDVKGFSNLNLDFDLGNPFKPYEQLLAVLPTASKNLLPASYHHLMTDDDSTIKHFYPENFDTDLNGKRQEWEAVVLIPFLDEQLLLDAMHPCNAKLSAEEKRRNSHGPMLEYTYTSDILKPYDAPQYFETVTENHAIVRLLTIADIMVPNHKLIKGAYPGAVFDVYYPGFPTLKYLNYEAVLKKARVKVFEQPSRSDNMVLMIVQDEQVELSDDIPTELLGKCVFVGWPHLTEARIAAISNSKRKYISVGGHNQYNVEPKTESMTALFKKEGEGVIERYKNRLGIECGEAKILVQVQVMIGKKYVISPGGKLVLEKQYSELTANYPLQTIVKDIKVFVDNTKEMVYLCDLFTEGSTVFTLANPYYGSKGVIISNKDIEATKKAKISITVFDEPDFTNVIEFNKEILRSYKTLFNVASHLGIGNGVFARITSSLYISAPRAGEGGFRSVNIGLDLKFNKQNMELPGYTRRIGATWYYTDKTSELVREYADKFPGVIQFLSVNTGFDENMTVEKVFGQDWEDGLKEVQTWLKSLPTHNIEKQTCGSAVLEPEAIKEIENTVDTFTKTSTSKKVTMQIRVSFLYKPEIQSHTLVPDEKMTVSLFDRIVNVRSGFSVPLGLKGTIIAVKQSTTGNDRDTMYDVVFDAPFQDGLEMNCSKGRGYRLPKTAFINMSHGRRLLDERNVRAPPSSTAQQMIPTQAQRFQQLQKCTQPNSSPPQQYPVYTPPQYLGPPAYTAPTFPNNMPAYNHPVSPQQSVPSNSQTFYGQTNSYQQQAPPYFDPSQYAPNVVSEKLTQEQQFRQEENSAFAQFNASKERDTEKPKETHPQSDNSIKNELRNSNSNKEETSNLAIESDNNSSIAQQRRTVNTNFLKSLLKVGLAENKENIKKDNGHDKSTSDTSGTNLKFEMFSQVAKAPASIRLLTYYQSNGLGLPRYQYYNMENMERAQLVLPTGEIITGNPGANREEASENVATQALEKLLNKSQVKEQPQMDIPTPPKTWVDPRKSDEATVLPPKTDNVLLQNFVPLQAIKRQMSKPNDKNDDKTHRSDNASNNGGGVRKLVETQKADHSNKQQKKPPKERKSRIAANFAPKS